MSKDDRFERARTALVDLEERLAAGEPVGRNERLEVNAEYQAAEAEVNAERDEERRAAMEAAGVEPGPDQVIGG